MVCSPAAEDISLLEEDDLSGVEANSPVIGVLSPPFSEELVVLSLSVAAACSYSGDLSATSSATSFSEEGEEVDELSVAGACLCLPKNNLTCMVVASQDADFFFRNFTSCCTSGWL